MNQYKFVIEFESKDQLTWKQLINLKSSLISRTLRDIPNAKAVDGSYTRDTDPDK
jgi:hypothetical protein